jgi:hypothetical protein
VAIDGGRVSRNEVRGAQLDPALGLPRYVIYERRWVQWIELVLGVFVFGAGVVALGAVMSGQTLGGKYGPAILLCLPIGPLIVWEAMGKIRRWSCLVIAQLGFDDRMGDNPAGPVLWSEVHSMGKDSTLHVGPGTSARIPTFVVCLRPDPRQPLSPLGAQPKQLGRVVLQIGFRGEETLIPSLMEESFRQWQELQAVYAGF